MSTKILLIYYGISLFLISGCVVCDSPSDDFLEFRLVDNSNKDLFLNHADFNKDSILIFSTSQNRKIRYSSVLSYSGSDSFFRFSPLEFGQFYSNSKIIIFTKPDISDTLSITTETSCGKCGCSTGITNIIHEGKSATRNNHIYLIKVDI